MKILRLVGQNFLRMPDDILREKSPEITIYYTEDGYRSDMEFLNSLFLQIQQEFPNIKDSETRVNILSRNITSLNVDHTVLTLSIPVEEFIKLRKDGKIKEL